MVGKRDSKKKSPRTQPVGKVRAIPAGYRDGKLSMPRPAKPVKGAGHERLRWRKDGLLANHDKPEAADFKKANRSLQRWFYDALPAEHKAHPDKDYYITPEAWRLFADHLEFWEKEWERISARRAVDSATQKRARAKELKREKSKTDEALRSVAGRAKLASTELKAKLSRLKSFITNGDFSLFVDLLEASEPWLLDAVLAGLRIDEDGGLGSQPGAFFDCEEDTLLAWVAIGLANTAGKCPRSINASSLRTFDLEVQNAVEFRLLCLNILPVLRGLEQLTLMFHGKISTADLPAMPKLSLLHFNGQGDAHILLESLEKQSSLKVISLWSVPHIEVAAGQVSIFDHVRLESNHMGNLNPAALKVFVNMHRDHSQSESPPHWWRQNWALPEIRSTANGRVEAIDEPENPDEGDPFIVTVVDNFGKTYRHECSAGFENASAPGSFVQCGDILAMRPMRILDLSVLPTLSPEDAAWIAEANVSVSINRDLLTPLTWKALRKSRATLIMAGGDIGSDIALARLVADFQGKTLCVFSSEFTAEWLAALSECKAELWLDGLFHGNPPIIGAEEATILSQRDRPALLGPLVGIPEDVLPILKSRDDADLSWHERDFCKGDAKNQKSVRIQILYRKTNNKMFLVRALRCDNHGRERISESSFHYNTEGSGVWRIEAETRKLMGDGWQIRNRKDNDSVIDFRYTRNAIT